MFNENRLKIVENTEIQNLLEMFDRVHPHKNPKN